MINYTSDDLRDAIRKQKVSLLERILNSQPELLEQHFSDGTNALQLAVRTGISALAHIVCNKAKAYSPSLLKQLITYNQNNEFACNDYNAIQLAAKFASSDVIEQLCSECNEVELQQILKPINESDEETPFALAVQHNDVHASRVIAKYQEPALTRQLIFVPSSQQRLNLQEPKLLFASCKRFKSDMLFFLLDQFTTNIDDKKTKQQEKPVYLSNDKGNKMRIPRKPEDLDLIIALLRSKDSEGNRLIHIATRHGSPSAIAQIVYLARGCTYMQATMHGQSAKQIDPYDYEKEMLTSKNSHGEIPYCVAARWREKILFAHLIPNAFNYANDDQSDQKKDIQSFLCLVPESERCCDADGECNGPIKTSAHFSLLRKCVQQGNPTAITGLVAPWYPGSIADDLTQELCTKHNSTVLSLAASTNAETLQTVIMRIGQEKAREEILTKKYGPGKRYDLLQYVRIYFKERLAKKDLTAIEHVLITAVIPRNSPNLADYAKPLHHVIENLKPNLVYKVLLAIGSAKLLKIFSKENDCLVVAKKCEHYRLTGEAFGSRLKQRIKANKHLGDTPEARHDNFMAMLAKVTFLQEILYNIQRKSGWIYYRKKYETIKRDTRADFIYLMRCIANDALELACKLQDKTIKLPLIDYSQLGDFSEHDKYDIAQLLRDSAGQVIDQVREQAKTPKHEWEGHFVDAESQDILINCVDTQRNRWDDVLALLKEIEGYTSFSELKTSCRKKGLDSAFEIFISYPMLKSGYDFIDYLEEKDLRKNIVRYYIRKQLALIKDPISSNTAAELCQLIKYIYTDNPNFTIPSIRQCSDEQELTVNGLLAVIAARKNANKKTQKQSPMIRYDFLTVADEKNQSQATKKRLLDDIKGTKAELEENSDRLTKLKAKKKTVLHQPQSSEPQSTDDKNDLAISTKRQADIGEIELAQLRLKKELENLIKQYELIVGQTGNGYNEVHANPERVPITHAKSYANRIGVDCSLEKLLAEMRQGCFLEVETILSINPVVIKESNYRALFVACERGDERIIQLMLDILDKSGTLIEALTTKDRNHQFPIHYLAATASVPLLQRCLDNDELRQAYAQNDYSITVHYIFNLLKNSVKTVAAVLVHLDFSCLTQYRDYKGMTALDASVGDPECFILLFKHLVVLAEGRISKADSDEKNSTAATLPTISTKSIFLYLVYALAWGHDKTINYLIEFIEKNQLISDAIVFNLYNCSLLHSASRGSLTILKRISRWFEAHTIQGEILRAKDKRPSAFQHVFFPGFIESSSSRITGNMLVDTDAILDDEAEETTHLTASSSHEDKNKNQDSYSPLHTAIAVKNIEACEYFITTLSRLIETGKLKQDFIQKLASAPITESCRKILEKSVYKTYGKLSQAWPNILFLLCAFPDKDILSLFYTWLGPELFIQLAAETNSANICVISYALNANVTKGFIFALLSYMGPELAEQFYNRYWDTDVHFVAGTQVPGFVKHCVKGTHLVSKALFEIFFATSGVRTDGSVTYIPGNDYTPEFLKDTESIRCCFKDLLSSPYSKITVDEFSTIYETIQRIYDLTGYLNAGMKLPVHLSPETSIHPVKILVSSIINRKANITADYPAIGTGDFSISGEIEYDPSEIALVNTARATFREDSLVQYYLGCTSVMKVWTLPVHDLVYIEPVEHLILLLDAYAYYLKDGLQNNKFSGHEAEFAYALLGQKSPQAAANPDTRASRMTRAHLVTELSDESSAAMLLGQTTPDAVTKGKEQGRQLITMQHRR